MCFSHFARAVEIMKRKRRRKRKIINLFFFENTKKNYFVFFSSLVCFAFELSSNIKIAYSKTFTELFVVVIGVVDYDDYSNFCVPKKNDS